MLEISGRHTIHNLSPQNVWDRLEPNVHLLLPDSIVQASSEHFREVAAARYGFTLAQPWGALPKGDWQVVIDGVERKPAGRAVYHIEAVSQVEKIFSGSVTFSLTAADAGTQISAVVAGEAGAGLSGFSDELIGTLIRSLLREGWAALDRFLADGTLAEPSADHSDDNLAEHMAPLAVAAGVFSAGMALGLWLWRRKKREE